MTTIDYRFVVKRDSAAAFAAANTLLLEGEWALELDTRKMKIGDGVTAWNDLGYFAGSSTGAEIGNLHVYHSGTFTTSSGAGTQKVPLDTVAEDTLGIWDAVNHEAVIREGGIYIAVFHRTTATTPVQAEALIGLNEGAPAVPVASKAWNEGATYYAASMNIIKLAAGDRVWAGVFKAAAVGIVCTENEGFRLIGPIGPAASNGYAEGDSFPVTPAPTDGQKFYRTDLNQLCFYKASAGVWLTANEYVLNSSNGSVTSFTSNVRICEMTPRADMWITDVFISLRVHTAPNDATRFWTATLFKSTPAEASTSIGAAANTSAVGVGTSVINKTTVQAALGSGFSNINLWCAKTGAPGALWLANVSVYYRVIVP